MWLILAYYKIRIGGGKMKLLRAIFIVMIVLFFVPRVVHAEGPEEAVLFYCQEEGEEYDYQEDWVEIELDENLTEEEKAGILFQELTENKGNRISFVPEGTGIIWVSLNDGKLLINFTKEAENSAGNYRERHFVKQIVKTAYSLEEISSIIIYVEGEESNLPEGIDFSVYDRTVEEL